MNSSIYESGAYLEANPDWHAGDAPFKVRWIEAMLRRHALPLGHVVDIGSGSGEVIAELAQSFPKTRFEGYEISPQAHAIAATKATDNLSYNQGDYFALAERQPDLLMAIDVVEHVEDYIDFVSRMKLGATYKLFHIPLDLSVQGLLRSKPVLSARKAVGHIHYFYKDTAFAMLRECGHEIVDWNYTHGAEEMGEAWRTRLFNIPRRLARAISPDLGVRIMGGASILVLTR